MLLLDVYLFVCFLFVCFFLVQKKVKFACVRASPTSAISRFSSTVCYFLVSSFTLFSKLVASNTSAFCTFRFFSISFSLSLSLPSLPPSLPLSLYLSLSLALALFLSREPKICSPILTITAIRNIVTLLYLSSLCSLLDCFLICRVMQVNYRRPCLQNNHVVKLRYAEPL